MSADFMTKAMFGMYAMHVPFNCIIQRASDDPKRPVVTLLGQSAGPEASDLLYGSKATHQLILGDAVIRPHAIIESDAFRGCGLSALATMCQADWIDNDHKVLLDQVGMEEIRNRLYGREWEKRGY